MRNASGCPGKEGANAGGEPGFNTVFVERGRAEVSGVYTDVESKLNGPGFYTVTGVEFGTTEV